MSNLLHQYAGHFAKITQEIIPLNNYIFS